MAKCSQCHMSNRSEASYCRYCGTALRRRAGAGEGPKPPVRTDLWLPFDYVISHPLRRWGAWGALAALIGSMVPWARQSVSFLGVEVGGSLVDAPQAMMLGLLALVGGLLVFHRYASVAVMVIGGIITLTVLLFVMQASGANPSWGLFLSGGGGAGLAYCGYQTRPPSRTS